MGLLAMGSKAFGFSSGFAVKVGNEDPGPQRIMACSPVEAELVAWGIANWEVMKGFQCADAHNSLWNLL